MDTQYFYKEVWPHSKAFLTGMQNGQRSSRSIYRMSKVNATQVMSMYAKTEGGGLGA